jgi:hypothetical protein
MSEEDRERRRATDRAYSAANRERKREWQRTYRAAHPERLLEQARAYRAAHREQRREYDREYRAANAERLREQRRTTDHGITRPQRDALYAAQGGLCAGCEMPFPNDDLEIDHDHECCSGAWSCGGCIRGLLCHGCNCRDALAGEAWVA